jgi:phosphotriesterase-related protein
MTISSSPQSPKRLLSVLGPVDPVLTGVFDAHNHVWIERLPGVSAQAPFLDDEIRIRIELTDFAANGGSGLADCQPGGCGRNGNRLAELAHRTGLIIIGCTGFHRQMYYPQSTTLFTMPADEISRYFIAEIQTGMTETLVNPAPVRAGFIKIALEKSLQNTPQAALEAAIQAAMATGAAMEIHTEKGAAAEEMLTFCTVHGLAPEKLVLCHMDKRPDPGLHCELAKAGAMLEYDTFFRPKYAPEQNLWPLIRHMVNAGLEAHVACAADLAEKSQWKQFGGEPGLSALPRVIAPRLTDQGYPPETVQRLTGGNILNCLAFAFT